MRISRRHAIASLLAVVAGHAPATAADAVRLQENTKPGDAVQCEVQLTLAGKLKIDRDGKPDTLPLEARAKHTFLERIESAQAVRHYREASSESIVGGDRSKRVLPEDRRGILIQRTTAGPFHFSPTGPLTRDELELVGEHFDTLAVPGLLPGKDVNVGDTWAIANETVQAACLFDGLIKHDLVGKLVGVKDGVATVSVTGKAEGIEHGAIVRLSVAAECSFDTAKQVISSVRWEQTDDREQGPISPAMEAKATVTVTRTPAVESKDVTDLRAKLPADGKVPDVLAQLRHADGTGYELVYPRDWHVVVKNDKHLVLRLLDRGEFVAQATIAVWKPAPTNTDPKDILAEFVEATKKQPGWDPEKVLENGMLQAGAGRQLYRLSASGKQDGLAVVQSFHLLSGEKGQHVAVACVSNAATAAKVGTRDVALVSAIDFPAKK
jgi:hypothetical protein